MEKLSIEEKAKAYDEAIERAKAIYQGSYKLDTAATIAETLQNVFPELKESEDNRIRRAIRNLVLSVEQERLSILEITQSDVIAWLEKQATPQVRTGIEWVNTIDDACDKQYAEEYAHGEYCHEQSFKWGFQEGVEWLERQGSQNLANYAKTCKVEPKFHKGEWLCENEPNNYARFIQILETVNVQGKNRYSISRDIHNDEDIVDFDFVEKYYHKFGIQDAKDGDVLVASDDSIFLFKSVVDGGCKHYIALTTDNIIKSNEGLEHYWETSKAVHPATKEQRDLLFQKMKEAGYEWDAEKKVLKKTEHKPNWSKDDEYYYGIIQYVLNNECVGKKDKEIAINWLKALKERVQLDMIGYARHFFELGLKIQKGE